MRPRTLARLAKDPGSAVARLKRRMEKTAVDLGPVVSAAGVGGLVGGLPMALLNAFGSRGLGKAQMLHDATVGGIVGAVPGALFSGIQGYQAQKQKEHALREYMRNGGYGGEFLLANPGPSSPHT